MQNVEIHLKQQVYSNNSNVGLLSVCHTAEESERLLKLFQIFIEIDKKLKKTNEKETTK